MSAKSFVTEKELDEEKKRRQEEWDRVRQPGQPETAPEPEDTRPLYERLKEQRDLKQMELDEANKLRNMLRGLDTEEVGFLDYVDDMRKKEEQKRLAEEKQLFAEVKKQTAEADTIDTMKISELTRRPIHGSNAKSNDRNKQAQLLAGAVKKRKVDGDTNDQTDEKKIKATGEGVDQGATVDVRAAYPSASVVAGIRPSATRSVGILPGLETYVGDSSDESSNSSDSEDIDECLTTPVQMKLERQVQKQDEASCK